ncbi:MAG: glycolate oxidase iron-sulfur subunit [Rhodocyclales bacterium GWA2_65_20]|nr:MAG: glycolate oxidase iron-sulfur subunit [Rhodocyclales bacterium GWA2_65_20]
METHLADFIRHTSAGREAEEILGRCVHCGFCTATCPTYQLLGDELDGPRGRIYLIKQVLEGVEPTEKTRLHLDRCLSCRSCETTCPSGVHYTRLLDIGREVVESKVPRTGGDAVMRGALKNLLPRSMLFGAAMKLGQSVRMVLPGALRAMVPPLSSAGPAPQRSHARRLIALAGCVQPSMYPNVNGATRRVLDRLGIQMVEAEGAGCCGAVRAHLNAAEAARDDARRNIDAWWPLLESGAEGLVMTASGCGSHVLEYAYLLQDDPDYAVKAARVVLATRDISEVIAAEAAGLAPLLQACTPLPESERALAFHSPCSLQHGLKIRGTVEPLLTAAGYALTAVADSHLCCGSAGTYSVLQPVLSQRLRDNKIGALTAGGPALIASANVGCMGHLQGATALPVKHWIEVLDARLSS